jgi:hypothetical protein
MFGVLSGRSLCDELITRPEECSQLWCAVVCEIKKPRGRGGHSPRWAAEPEKIIIIIIIIIRRRRRRKIRIIIRNR